jgi:predicted glycosyltransferase
LTHRILVFPSGMFSVSDGRYVELGNGHVVRCVNLARELVSQDPQVEVTLGVSGPEAAFARRFVGDEFSIVEIPEVDGTSPHWQYEHRLRFEANLVRFLEPSVVICDTHAEGLIAARYNWRKCAAILDLPPIEFFHVYAMLADLVLVPLAGSEYRLPAMLEAKSHFVGPLIDARSIDRVNSESEAELREEIGIDRAFILVYLSRIHSDRELFVSIVREAHRIVLGRHPEIVLVLIGPGARQEAEDDGHVIALEFVDNIHKYVKASSAFITRSPIIAMEGLALGKKAVVVPIPSDHNQSTMAQRLGKDTTYLPFEKLDAETLARLIEDAISGESRAEGASIAGNGTAESARMVLELVNSG